MGNIDLFGNSVEQKALTSMQRLSTRQVSLSGRDLYTTESKDIERFLNALKRDGVVIPSPIWEPAAGRGDISKTLINNGHPVISSDIIPYHDSEITVNDADFFTKDRIPYYLTTNGSLIPCKTIFTNPPFNVQEEFLIHALSFGVDVIFFVRLSFLSSIRRGKIFDQYNPAYVYVYSGLAHCYKDGDENKGQNMIDYCVMMWKYPHKAETIMRRIK